MSRNVLVVEDQQDIAGLIKLHLQDLSCEVRLAYDGVSGLAEAQARDYDLIVLDLMLPGIDGLELTRRLRAKANYTPILMVTAKGGELDRVLGLELGADDYLTKPFSILELVARAKALFRRIDALAASAAKAGDAPIRAGELAIDPTRREVTLGDRRVALTAKEFDLLLHFAQHPGRVFSRMQLLDTVWGYGHDGYDHTVNSHINRLRDKLGDRAGGARGARFIHTVWGVGYRFEVAA